MKRIALVEDFAAIREMLAIAIKTHPKWKIVAQSGDGHSAIDDCIRAKAQLVVLDIMLPGLHGTEVLRRLFKWDPQIRVLVFSAYPSCSLLKEIIQAGAQGFVEKSASLEELYKGLETVANGGTYFSRYASEILRSVIASPYGEPQGQGMQRLTAREREVLQLIAESHSTKAIAVKLSISIKTADNHRTNLMKKLNLHDVASLTRFAIEQEIVQPRQVTQSFARPTLWVKEPCVALNT